MTTVPLPAQEPLCLPRHIGDQIVAHARREAPRECCGVIGGTAGEMPELYTLTNIEPGTTRYRIDDAELYRVYRELDERGGEILAIYHSHPATPAYPSPTDVALALWPEAHYVICSLVDPGRPDLRAFRIVDGQVVEVPVSS